MRKRGRFCIAAFMACAILLASAADIYPSNDVEAGRKYAVACQRLSDLKRSRTKKKYRSYWLDCIRTFELVEQRYPKSPRAADSCLERAGAYLDLYRFNRRSGDLNSALQVYGSCQSSYPSHPRAPEALYRTGGIYLDYKRDASSAAKTFDRLASLYPDSPWTSKARSRLGPSAGNRKNGKTEVKTVPVPEITSLGTIKGIRHWSNGAYTRIVIDMDRKIKFQASEVKNPDRLFFDLQNARIGDQLIKEPLPINDGILKQVRVSQYAADTVRVVLDLASLKSYVAFPLQSPDRVVIDITGESGEAMIGSTDSEPALQVPPPAQKGKADSGEDDKLSLSRQMGLKIKTIAIDAGHGGHDPGAIGRGGLKEKNVTLDIARRLAELVKEKLGCNVIMTRDKDVFVPLDQRPFIAKSRGADLFISIHINANRKRRARGIETYIQGIHASDTDAMATAARENAMSTKKLSELKSELDRILKDLASDSKNEDSLQLAHAVQTSLVINSKPYRKQVVNLGVKRAFFYVLINTEMPSILAEVGFISNPDEEKLLRRDSYRQSLAESLLAGIKKYIDSRSPQALGI